MNRPRNQRGGDSFDAFFGDASDTGSDVEEPTQEVPVGRSATAGGAAAGGSVPDSWWTGEPDQPRESAPAPSSSWSPAAAPVPVVASRPAKPRRRVSPVGVVALALGIVLVLGAGAFGAMNLFDGGDGEPTAAPSTSATSTSEPTANGPSSTSSSSSDDESSSSSSDETTSEDTTSEEETSEESEESEEPTETETSEETATEEETSEETTSEEETSEESEEPTETETTTEEETPEPEETEEPTSSSTTMAAQRSGQLPQGVTPCGGEIAGTKAGSGTNLTSCAFANVVLNAYVATAPEGGPANLTVHSPVTDQTYEMSCSGGSITRCTGGNNAVVVLY